MNKITYQSILEPKDNHNNNLSCAISLYLKIWNRKDDNIWDILKIFYISSKPLYLNDVKRLLIMNHKILHRNTYRNCFERLLEDGFIKLVAVNVGPNKNRKYYSISENGEKLWEEYIARK